MKYTKITTIIFALVVGITLNAQDNTFNGTTDNNWDNASNWSTGKAPPSHIVQKITIAADCVVPATNSTDYNFAEGSTFQINSGITFTNNGIGTWTMNGTYDKDGIFVGNLALNGKIEPGSNSSTWVCGDPLIYDGQSYATVQIGGQCWMAENLNIGIMINGDSSQINNNIIEKYCYSNDAANCATYGGMYQWDEVMQYTLIESTQGVCPTGWHLPSRSEWTTLVDFLGGIGVNTGSKMAGNAALWVNDDLVNDPEFDASGLSGLPGGYRNKFGSFFDQGKWLTWWSSTETALSSDSGRILILYYMWKDAFDQYNFKEFGYNVRCLRD